MESKLKQEITRFVMESEENWSEVIQAPYYDEPIIQFASADDPLFQEYKSIIGNHHFTPREAFEHHFGEESFKGGTVISIVMPIHERIRIGNRAQKDHASQEWALLRVFGDEQFLEKLQSHVVTYLSQRGHRTVTPIKADFFKIHGTETGPTSNWSERHIAYAAGLGTFGINDGFISEKGIAIRLISFVTELKLAPDGREALHHTENCLLYSKGICGACIKRCPVQAISNDGHDKLQCMKFVYGEESRQLAVSFGGSAKTGSGCGLCQTKVPCESKNPMRAVKSVG